jgi:hypothetical protein
MNLLLLLDRLTVLSNVHLNNGREVVGRYSRSKERTIHSQLGRDTASLCYKVLILRPLVLLRVA